MSERIYDTIINFESITKGWSEDKKYCVTTADGIKYLLRITPISRYETRKSLFAMLEQVAALGIPMCVPVEFGTCDDGVYSIQSWIDGEDLETVLYGVRRQARISLRDSFADISAVSRRWNFLSYWHFIFRATRCHQYIGRFHSGSLTLIP